jgi:polysaccharide pyruvyl transferase WcaK-like protein
MRRIPRVGLFGNLGSGNIGNDASLEAMLSYLRTEQPQATVDAMCLGPDTVKERYGIAAIPLKAKRAGVSGRAAAGIAGAAGKVIDTARTARWVRDHDVVIVPGMGVLETTQPLRPWQFPYDMFVLCAAGKLFRTKVALVGIGANVSRERLTRWLFVSAARMAAYRSYRDALSRDAMCQQGLDTARDHVYTDLAFGLPVRHGEPGDAAIVGIGVMDYHGTNDDDRHQADEIRAAYAAKMKTFIRWLVDGGRSIRLFIGDTNNSDATVVAEIMADIQAARPGLDPARVVAEPVSTFSELVQAVEPAGTVVATRYHNVICALALGKPTLSIGYGAKNAAIMTAMGLAEYCQVVGSLDVGQLIRQFTDLESNAARLRQAVAEHRAANQALVARQRAELSEVLFGPPESAGLTGPTGILEQART